MYFYPSRNSRAGMFLAAVALEIKKILFSLKVRVPIATPPRTVSVPIAVFIFTINTSRQNNYYL